MKIFIQNAQLVHPSHSLHGKNIDLFIENGLIRQLGSGLTPDDDATMIRRDNLHVSAGWMDCFANFCDPGQEYKETIESGAAAAAAGGYTDVMTVPNTLPVVSNKGQVEYLIQKSKSTSINIHPIGSVSLNCDEKELAEMYDMAQAGAIAFSEGKRPVQSAGMLQKALEYVMAIDGVIIQVPDDQSIGKFGLMNEGIVSTRLGMPGKPAISEELMVARDIELARYTGSRIHFTGISTEKSVKLISKAKEEGLKVTCSVTPYHLFFCDEDLSDYDTNLKVNPPLRTAADRQALIKAAQDGSIDFIASHHQPQDYDHKICEFEKAAFGMETLETVFAAAMTAGISPEIFVRMQTEIIRSVFNREKTEIAEGAPASLTLFDPVGKQIVTKDSLRSRSSNNAFLQKNLTGKVFGTVHKGSIFMND